MMATLGVLALARLVTGRRGLLPGPRRPIIRGPHEARFVGWMHLLPVVFTVQLATFVVQEGAEALATGAPMPSVVGLVLWGSLGMLPVAILAAFVLSWLSVHLEAAVQRLRSVAHSFRPQPSVILSGPGAGRLVRPSVLGCARRVRQARTTTPHPIAPIRAWPGSLPSLRRGGVLDS